MEDVKKFEEKAIRRYYGESGIIDLLIGIASLIISVGIYFEFQYIVVFAFPIIALLSRYFRKKLIFPRLGQVEFKSLNQKKLQKELGNLILIPIIPFILILIFVPEPQGHMYAFSILLIMLIGQALYRILNYKLSRMFIYFFVFMISISLLLITQQYEYLIGGGLLISIVGMGLGLPLTLRFLKRYPILEGDEEFVNLSEINRLERLAIKRYYGESGIIDLLIGIAFLMLSIGIYFEIKFFVIYELIILILLGIFLRKNIILPRLGFAEFNNLKKNKIIHGMVIILAFNFVLAILVFEYAPPDLWTMYLLIVVWIFFISQGFYSILVYRVYRLFAYLIIFMVTSYMWLIMENIDALFWGGMLIGFPGIGIGLSLTLRFIRLYPILEEK